MLLGVLSSIPLSYKRRKSSIRQQPYACICSQDDWFIIFSLFLGLQAFLSTITRALMLFFLMNVKIQAWRMPLRPSPSLKEQFWLFEFVIRHCSDISISIKVYCLFEKYRWIFPLRNNYDIMMQSDILFSAHSNTTVIDAVWSDTQHHVLWLHSEGHCVCL